MPCRDEKIDGKIIQLEEDIMNILNDVNILLLFISYQSPASGWTVLIWTQGNDENDPDKRNCICIVIHHIWEKEKT